jgi:hypothetical protein
MLIMPPPHNLALCRLDKLPFSVYHWFLVVSLGITWMLDGLEVTVHHALFCS